MSVATMAFAGRALARAVSARLGSTRPVSIGTRLAYQSLGPGRLFGGNRGNPLDVPRSLALQAAQFFGNRRRRRPGIAIDGDLDRLDQTESPQINIHLDDLRALRPVVEAVLGQGAEGTEAGAQGEHHIRPGQQFHRRLRTLVAERAGSQFMAGRGRCRCAGRS
jgi:hypothetical protein